MDDAEWNGYVKKKAIENQRKLGIRAIPKGIKKPKEKNDKRKQPLTIKKTSDLKEKQNNSYGGN